MNKAARTYQDGLMRDAMREMTDNAVQAFIDRDPRHLDCEPLESWPACRACRWGSMAHAEMHHRNFIRNTPSKQGDRLAHHV